MLITPRGVKGGRGTIRDKKRTPTDRSLEELIKKHNQGGMRLREVRYERGDTLYDQGEPAHWVCLLTEGEVDLVKRALNGKRYIVVRLSPGDLVGIEALFKDPEHTDREYTAEVISPTRAILIERGDFWRLLEDGETAGEIVRALCRALRARDHRIGYLLCEGILERVAGVLLYLSQRDRARADPDTSVLRVTHAQIAAFIGSTPETVCKELKRLQRRKAVIERGRSQITLCTERLATLANGK